jgi:hypothetical protein
MTASRRVLTSNYGKVKQSINLLRASIEKYKPFDPEHPYTPEELEPYDALSDRFMRSIETSIRYFRSLRLHDEGIDAETLRDLLLYMQKRDLVSDPDLWIEMRDLRNRIVHDYIPEKQKEIYNDIVSRFAGELFRLVELMPDAP